MWILQGINSCFPAVGFRNISGYCVGAVDAWRTGAGRHQSNINKKEDFIRLKNRSNGQHAEVSLLLKSICFVKLRLRVGGGKRQIQQNVTISQADHPPTLQTDLNSFFSSPPPILRRFCLHSTTPGRLVYWKRYFCAASIYQQAPLELGYLSEG